MITRRRFVQAAGAVAAAVLVPVNRLHAYSELLRIPSAVWSEDSAPWIHVTEAEVIARAREAFEENDRLWLDAPEYVFRLLRHLPVIHGRQEDYQHGVEWIDGEARPWVRHVVRRYGAEVPARLRRPRPDWWPR